MIKKYKTVQTGVAAESYLKNRLLNSDLDNKTEIEN
jgi:hypothetical protein